MDSVLSNWFERREAGRDLMEQTFREYRERLVLEGKHNQTSEQVLDELARIRDETVDEFYPN